MKLSTIALGLSMSMFAVSGCGTKEEPVSTPAPTPVVNEAPKPAPVVKKTPYEKLLKNNFVDEGTVMSFNTTGYDNNFEIVELYLKKTGQPTDSTAVYNWMTTGDVNDGIVPAENSQWDSALYNAIDGNVARHYYNGTPVLFFPKPEGKIKHGVTKKLSVDGELEDPTEFGVGKLPSETKNGAIGYSS